MDNKYLNQLIENAVANYKTTNYNYLDEVKTLVFNYLLNGYSYEDFDEKLKKLNTKYFKNETSKQKKEMKKVKSKMKEQNEKGEQGTFKISKKELDSLKFKLDNKNEFKARDKFYKVVKNYYKDTAKVLNEEYIDEDAYLSAKLDNYDKIEQVIPYRSHNTGEVVAYHDIASYNSMIYNVNLLNTAWNTTFEDCKELDEDIVYIEPHPFACDCCREYQGKFYSVTGKSKKYPPLQKAIDGGLKHPNCKHIITTYYGQEETDDYSGARWAELYKDKQKLNAVKLKISRLETDRDIYKKLNNGEKVDKINDTLSRLKIEENLLKEKTRIN